MWSSAPNRLYPFETHGVFLGKRYVFGNVPLVNYLPDILRGRLVPHARAYTRGRLRRLYRWAGLRPLAHSYVFPGFDHVAARRKLVGRALRALLYPLGDNAVANLRTLALRCIREGLIDLCPALYRFRRNRARRVQLQRGRTARSRWSMLLGLIFLFAFSGVIAAAVVGFLVYQSYASDLKSPQELISEASIRTSLVYDRNGEFLFEFIDPVGELRDPVPIADISPFLIAATVATEDASFYENPGLNVNGLLRAFRTNLPESLGERGSARGAGAAPSPSSW